MKSRRRDRQPEARANRHSDKQLMIPRITEDDFYEIVAKNPGGMILILDEVTDPHNLGACLRSANAAGVLGIVTPKHHSASVSETVCRIACGAAEVTPVVQVTNLSRAMKKFQELGFWLVGTADEGEKSIYEQDLTGGLGLVMGAEGKGLRRLTRETCDFLVRIPMLGQVDCLNVSVATGVCLFEAVRQRN